METSTKITYATLSSDELVGRARAATTFASIGGRAGAVILAFALNNFSIPGFFFGISLILSMACFYFSWNTYHLGLNFEELYRDFKVNWEDRIGVVKALSRRTFLFRWALYMPAISSMKVQVTTPTDAQGNSWSIQEFC